MISRERAKGEEGSGKLGRNRCEQKRKGKYGTVGEKRNGVKRLRLEVGYREQRVGQA